MASWADFENYYSSISTGTPDDALFRLNIAYTWGMQAIGGRPAPRQSQAAMLPSAGAPTDREATRMSDIGTYGGVAHTRGLRQEDYATDRQNKEEGRDRGGLQAAQAQLLRRPTRSPQDTLDAVVIALRGSGPASRGVMPVLRALRSTPGAYIGRRRFPNALKRGPLDGVVLDRELDALFRALDAGPEGRGSWGSARRPSLTPSVEDPWSTIVGPSSIAPLAASSTCMRSSKEAAHRHRQRGRLGGAGAAGARRDHPCRQPVQNVSSPSPSTRAGRRERGRHLCRVCQDLSGAAQRAHRARRL